MVKKDALHTLRYLLPKGQIKRPGSGSNFEDLLLGEPVNPTNHEQALWRAVILQMVTDALSLSRKSEARHYKREALAWLTSYSRDFRTVCELAGFEPEYIHGCIKLFLETHRPSKSLKPLPPAPPPDPAPFTMPGLQRSAFSIRSLRLKTMRVNLSELT